MKKIDKSAVTDIVAGTGISRNKIDKIIGTITITLARQAAKEPGRKINFNEKSRPELEESLRIGADLSPDQAKTIFDNLEKAVKEQNDPLVTFLEEGTFKIDKDEIEFETDLD